MTLLNCIKIGDWFYCAIFFDNISFYTFKKYAFESFSAHGLIISSGQQSMVATKYPSLKFISNILF